MPRFRSSSPSTATSPRCRRCTSAVKRRRRNAPSLSTSSSSSTTARTTPPSPCSSSSPPRIRASASSRSRRNFGAHTACLAGLCARRGDCVAMIAADLQEPPDLPWRCSRAGARRRRSCSPTRRTRDDELSQIALRPSLLSHHAARGLSEDCPTEGFDCFLLDRRVVAPDPRSGTTQCPAQRTAALDGLQLRAGRTTTVCARPLAAVAGRLAKTRQTVHRRGSSGFPTRRSAPCRLPVCRSACSASPTRPSSFCAAVDRRNISGWSSLMAALLVVSGLQLIALGILGEYVWRALDAARRRPNFIIAETRNLAASPPSPPHHHETTTQ